MAVIQEQRIFQTKHVDETREWLSKFNSLDQFDVVGRDQDFDLRIHAAPFSGFNLFRVSYGDAHIKVEDCDGGDPDGLTMLSVTEGSGRVHNNGQEVEMTKAQGLMRDHGSPLLSFQQDFSCIAISFSKASLTEHARILLGEDANLGALEFDSALDMVAPGGRHVRDTLSYIANAALDRGVGDLNNPIVLGGMRDILFSNVLMLLPNSYTELFDQQATGSIVPYYVKRARDYIHAHISDCITLEKLANHAGCGYRALQLAFNDAYGVPPMAYVKSVRLVSVRKDLLNADNDDTVSSVALKWGFTHMGRFSQMYAIKFGVLPSETLRSRR